MNEFSAARAAAVASAIRHATGAEAPDLAVVLGSGLAAVAEFVEAPRAVAFADVPGLPVPSVPGHPARIVAGTLGGRRVIVFAGRVHHYEGHGAAAAAFTTRVAHALGARALVVTNAAGGIRPTLRPGDFMVIEDQINLTFRNPLIGPVEPGDERFPDMSAPYDAGLTAALERGLASSGGRVTRGVYAGVAGPSYETPAEIRALALLGADAVGMSTVPEVVVACALRLQVAGVAVITNSAVQPGAPLSHDEVLAAAHRACRQLPVALASLRFTASARPAGR